MTATLPQLDSSWWDHAELRPVLAARDVAGGRSETASETDGVYF